MTLTHVLSRPLTRRYGEIDSLTLLGLMAAVARNVKRGLVVHRLNAIQEGYWR